MRDQDLAPIFRGWGREQFTEFRRKFRRDVCAPGGDWLADRQERAERLEECRADDGSVAVYYWGRDCDMCESSSVSVKRWSGVMLWERAENQEAEWAEGPFCVRPIPPEDAAEFEPTFRDRVAEAWDNGNTTPYLV